MEIKAIETVYNGYKFRSRLEARYAVFFDKLGIKYEYEKEGYDLGDEGYYLPDFWLPNNYLHVEVKGEYPSDEYMAMLRVFRDKSNSGVLLAVGLPLENKLTLMANDCTDSSGGAYEEEVVIEKINNGKIQLLTNTDSRVNRDRSVFCDWGDITNTQFDITYSQFLSISPYVIDASTRARQARFEHGEKSKAINRCICENGFTFGVDCFENGGRPWSCLFCGKSEIIKDCDCNHMLYHCPYCDNHLT